MRQFAAIGIVLLAGAPWTASARAEVDEAVVKAEADRIAVVAKARDVAVAVFAPGGQGGGSGVVISPDGYALSNFHVTKGAGDAMKCGMADGRMYDAVIVGIDPVGDVAVLKLLGRNDFPCAELADSDQVQVGDWAFAIGNPFLLATDFQPSVSYGIISGVRRYQYPAGTLLEYTDCIQTDASINPGNSGGPLFDAAGRLIGINGRGSFEKRGRVNVGVGYAISINQIKNFLGHLKSGRIVDHATLGARVGSQPDGRVTVVDILEGCDAYRRGLRYGDEIVRFGGRDIRTVNAFKNVLGIFPKDWRVPLTYRREGKTYDILVRLEGLHSTDELVSKVQGQGAAPQPAPDGPMPDAPMPKAEPGKGGPRPAAPKGKPMPAMARRGAAPMPKEVKDVFESHRGYANFHFNKVERSRVWGRAVARGDFHELNGPWVLKGELAAGGDAELKISDTQSAVTMPGGKLELALSDDLKSSIDPPGSGGLLAAMSLWRRLLIVGPDKFGDLAYLGTVPLPGPIGAPPAGAPVLADALIGYYGGVECRFLFDPKSGDLAVVEMYREEDDPCELHFSDYAEVEGRQFPRRLEVRYGDGVYATIKFTDIKLEKAEAK